MVTKPRFWIIALSLLGLLRSSVTDALGQPWYRHSLVGLEVGPTGSQFGGSTNDTDFAVRFNGRDIVRAAHACGAEYLVIWAREGDWAFYDSALQPRPPGLGSRDVLREAVDEGRVLNMPIIAYCQVQYPAHTLREHPEWHMVDKDGQRIEGRVCYRSGYLDYMKQMVEEQLAYGIDGFHLDMVDQGFGSPYGCWCETCQEVFESRYDHPMPKDVTWDEAWDDMLEFRYEASAAFESKLTEHIRRINAKASVDFNYHGNPPFSWEVGQRPVQHASHGDFVTGETGVWGFSALTVGLNAEFYRAATPGKRFQIAMQRGVRMYHDQTTRPLEDIRWELFTLLSHGGFVTMVDKTAFDGWLDPLAYERFGQAFREARAKREHFGQEPVYDVGLYFSSRTRDWYGRGEPAQYFQSFLGAHKAMVYEHIPWGVVLDENVSLARLKRFPVVLLPNLAILSESEVSLFHQYVAQGGCLLLTGLPGLRGWRGERLDHSQLELLLGAQVVRELGTTDNWIRFSSESEGDLESRFAPRGRMDWPFLVRGPAVVYEATSAQPIGALLEPHRTALHEENRYNADWPLSADAPIGPALLIHRLGRGQVLTMAGSPDWASASDHHITETRRLLAHAVRWLHPSPHIEIDAPVAVQTVVTDDSARRTLRVHFMGYQAPPQTLPAHHRPYALPVPMEEAPMYRAKISVRGTLKDARAFYPETKIETRDNQVDLQVERVHEVVTIRY